LSTSAIRVLPYGERAVLVELAEDQVIALLTALTGTPGIGELIPGARTLLVPFDPHIITTPALTSVIDAAVRSPAPDRPQGPLVVIPVRYDGPDLDAVVREVGCDPEEIIRRHTAPEYTVAFCGFAPGFAYLRGLDPSLQVPRLARPRTRVPAGSVGVAGEFTAAYPRSSPGGWQLLGRTEATLWDLDRVPPALLTPGTRVRFDAL
jgi:KipI family sensor histidine kinase inhibitor